MPSGNWDASHVDYRQPHAWDIRGDDPEHGRPKGAAARKLQTNRMVDSVQI